MAHAPTMNDVARAADVSLKTVSRFINGETNINPILAARIQTAVENLGYRRNLAAASIRPGWTSKTLGLVISDVANPYYASLTRSVERLAADHGFLLTMASSNEDGARHDHLIERLMEQRVDGLIVVPPRRPGRAWSTVAAPVPPIVFVDRPSDLEGANTVLADNRGGAREATAALLAAPAKRIAFIGDSLELYTMRERHEGYREALEATDTGYDDALVRSSAHTTEEATEIVASLIADGSADAIFAANNRASIGALIAFSAAGRRLPLIGFDDFEAATLVNPPVSTVDQDAALMGTTATEMIFALIAGATPEAATVVLPTALRLRGSERR